MATVAESLDQLDGVSRVRRVDATRPGHSVVLAAVRPRAVDALLEELRQLGVPDLHITVTRLEVVDWTATRPAEASLVWADVLGQAWLNARPIARYVVLMLVAGVIAGYGVIDRNVILIVGAMAVSPDLLPITAIGVSVVGRRPRLAGEAFLTLAVGLAAASVAAAIIAFAQDKLDADPVRFQPGDGLDRARGPDDGQQRDDCGRIRGRRGGHARARDARQLDHWCGGFGDDDPRRCLPRRRGRTRRAPDSRGRPGGPRHERFDDGAGRLHHARHSAHPQAPCQRPAQGGYERLSPVVIPRSSPSRARPSRR